MTHLSPKINSDEQMLVPAQCNDQTREIAWLAVRLKGESQTKTPPTSEDGDGVFRAFTSRKVAALD
jgi:hypothetical protein